MEIIPAQLAKNQLGDLLMKVQREPVEISKHGKRVAVANCIVLMMYLPR
nr:type II toxin-antitoxin system prevent-host-death family antitoxin [Xenorhabdus bovienii]